MRKRDYRGIAKVTSDLMRITDGLKSDDAVRVLGTLRDLIEARMRFISANGTDVGAEPHMTATGHQSEA